MGCSDSDYHLLRSLQNFLDGKTFASNRHVKMKLDEFFANKDQKFSEGGINHVPIKKVARGAKSKWGT